MSIRFTYQHAIREIMSVNSFRSMVERPVDSEFLQHDDPSMDRALDDVFDIVEENWPGNSTVHQYAQAMALAYAAHQLKSPLKQRVD